jgi:hypothetical protein
MTLKPKQALVITAPELLEPKGHNIIRETRYKLREKYKQSRAPCLKGKQSAQAFLHF